MIRSLLFLLVCSVFTLEGQAFAPRPSATFQKACSIAAAKSSRATEIMLRMAEESGSETEEAQKSKAAPSGTFYDDEVSFLPDHIIVPYELPFSSCVRY